MTRSRGFVIGGLGVLLLIGTTACEEKNRPVDTGGDADSDADTDADSDTDSDTDGDALVDAIELTCEQIIIE